jgi:hypothetical protein
MFDEYASDAPRQEDPDPTETLLLKRLRIGLSIGVIALAIICDRYPHGEMLLRGFIWFGLVFGFVIIERRAMLSRLSFWVVFLTVLTLHLILWWEIRGQLVKLNLWIAIIPIVFDAVLVQVAFELLKSKIEHSRRLW